MRSARPVLLVALLAAAGALAARAQTECVAISFTGAPGPTLFIDGFEAGDTLAWELPAPPSFSTTATEDLGVEVELGALPPGDHLLELRWYLPGGHLYQSNAVPFADDALPGDTRVVAGYPFRVEVVKKKPKPRPRPHVGEDPMDPDELRRVKPRPRPRPRPPGHPRSSVDLVAVVESRLPLAGTSIVEAGVWGEWRVEAYLDGAEAPCTPPVAFRLEP